MPKNWTLLSKSRSGLNRRSTASAPTDARLWSDRHADEAELLLGGVAAPGGAIEERRLAAHARHDDRLSALDDLAGNAFADPVADGPRAILEPLRRLDVQLAVAQQREHAAHDAVMAHQDGEHALHRGLEVEGAGERLAHLEQGGQAPRVACGGARYRRAILRAGIRSYISEGSGDRRHNDVAGTLRSVPARRCREAPAQQMRRLCSNSKFTNKIV